MAISARATQEFVPVKEVRDGVMVLKDGGLRAVVLCSSINLALKSYDEQKATLFQFQSFLNSLDFPVQIIAQSRKYDIRPYLLLLENRMKDQTEPLLKIQTREYIEFIRSLTEQINIMTKNFFVVVTFSPTAAAGAGGILKDILPGKKKEVGTKVTDERRDFEEKKSQLDQRVGVIEQGLSRLGVRTTVLGTEEIIELLYKTFNPGEVAGAIKAG
jgi:hypothetical protein